jgi:flagellum-specific peptidoglycan hydrolase FlgJ
MATQQQVLDFFEKIAPLVIKAGEKYDVYPSIMAAQAAIESAYGLSGLTKKYNNLTGMKVGGGAGIWSGTPAVMNTQEYTPAAGYYYANQSFRTYKDWQQSIDDLAHRHAIRFHITRTNSGSPAVFLDRVINSGYATGLPYRNAINSTIAKYNLLQLDNEKVKKSQVWPWLVGLSILLIILYAKNELSNRATAATVA